MLHGFCPVDTAGTLWRVQWRVCHDAVVLQNGGGDGERKKPRRSAARPEKPAVDYLGVSFLFWFHFLRYEGNQAVVRNDNQGLFFPKALRPFTHHSPLTTHHSPLTTHHSPLTTHYSPLTTHHSPLTTHHSPLTTHHSPLTTHHSLLTTHHSPLTTHYHQPPSAGSAPHGCR